MLKFRFAGHLRRHFRQITLNVETPAQGLRLLLAQSPEFKKDFYRTKVRVRVDGDDVTEESKNIHMNRHIKDGSTILFVPVIEGAGLETATIVAIVAVTLSVASVAYSLYMTSHMKNKSSSSQDTNSITNNSFTSVDNRIGQGRPVPLLLGEMVVGSNVISLGIDTSNNQDWSISIS